MPPSAARTLEANVQSTARIISLRSAKGKRAAIELERMLTETDRRLSEVLRREARRFGGATARFTGASAAAYRTQVQTALQFVQARLGGMTATQARRAIRESVESSTRLLGELEERFTGIARPLRVRQASVMDRIVNGTRASLLAQQATSVDRYGDAMVQKYEKYIRAGLIQGLSLDDMTAALTGHGGPRGQVSMRAMVLQDGTVLRLVEAEIPEGLFVRHRHWAERVVRTEVAHANQEARLRSLREGRRLDMPDLQKKIMAIFDDRTAPDSIAVHGQIRELDDYFVDGAGRQYLRPPARPNDRETLVPWRPGWKETAASQPLSPGRVADAIQRGPRARGMRRARLAEMRGQSRREMAQQRSELRREEIARRVAERRQQRERANEENALSVPTGL